MVDKIKKSIQIIKNRGYDIKLLAKWIMFPGFDLLTSSRYRRLTKYFRQGKIKTLDAGCGNGAFSYAAYMIGNSIVGVSNNQEQIEKASKLVKGIGLDCDRIKFCEYNLEAISELGMTFDQIIYFETLEHIEDDRSVITQFYDMLQVGGILHLCCPNAEHPINANSAICTKNSGGHVRTGYTYKSYEELLEPEGFRIVEKVGVGASCLVKADVILRFIRNKVGEYFAFPFFIILWPFQWFDRINSETPFSLYVQAIKDK
jgi:SAM-dependent methyltransferase